MALIENGQGTTTADFPMQLTPPSLFILVTTLALAAVYQPRLWISSLRTYR